MRSKEWEVREKQSRSRERGAESLFTCSLPQPPSEHFLSLHQPEDCSLSCIVCELIFRVIAITFLFHSIRYKILANLGSTLAVEDATASLSLSGSPRWRACLRIPRSLDEMKCSSPSSAVMQLRGDAFVLTWPRRATEQSYQQFTGALRGRKRRVDWGAQSGAKNG